jgi:hypothetical protein
MADNESTKEPEEKKAAAVERSTNLKEIYYQRAFFGFVPGAVLILFAILSWAYPSAAFAGFKWFFTIAGPLGVIYGIWSLRESKKIEYHELICPFCEEVNVFTEDPGDDVRCDSCNRQVPIVDGEILQVYQVRCGFCSHLNFYSDKSTGLICEECDRVIPISGEDDPLAKETFDKFTTRDDDNPYDLILLDPGKKTELMISVLQKMLALNRNQVKEIMEATPSLLLTRVPFRKADMLSKDIIQAGGRADYSVTKDD